VRGTGLSTDVTAAAAGTSDYGVTVGDAGAPHQVVIYEDFLCPFCGQLEKASHERLQELAEAGKVQVDYRPFHLLQPDYSAEAANAFKVVLDAAGPKVALAFHTELYADQPDESGPYPDSDWLVQKAVDAGAEESAVRPGIEDMSQQDWVDAATKAAEDTGLQGTPTVLLDGKVFTEGRTMDEVADKLVAAVS
jgi:protein-disulfide isomerase